jgi:hypothetical protein
MTSPHLHAHSITSGLQTLLVACREATAASELAV